MIFQLIKVVPAPSASLMPALTQGGKGEMLPAFALQWKGGLGGRSEKGLCRKQVS